jgi:hypothetical protein
LFGKVGDGTNRVARHEPGTYRNAEEIAKRSSWSRRALTPLAELVSR